jgi:hypothetical protein
MALETAGEVALLLPESASPEEAAAIAGALQRFLTDTAALAPSSRPRESNWVRSAREEALRRELGGRWGGPAGWTAEIS